MKPFFVWACLGAMFLGSNLLSEISAEETRPNILLIVADDLCRRDLGYEGNAEVRTPHLDQLCKESMHFQRMFNPATSCSPPGMHSTRGWLSQFEVVLSEPHSSL